MSTPAGASLTADGVVGSTFPRLQYVREQMAMGRDMGLNEEIVRLFDIVMAQQAQLDELTRDHTIGIGIANDRVSTVQDGLAETVARVDEMSP
jgi:hypothetical protein